MTRIGFIKRAIVGGPSGPLRAAAILAVAVALPLLIRLAAGPLLGDHAIFAAYFPAILLATVLLGWRLGLVVTILSAIAASYVLVAPTLTLKLGATDWASVVYFILCALLIVFFADTLRRTVIELEATARREAMLAAELGHRAKNNLLMIGALARQTQRAGKGEDGFFEALISRLDALSCAQDLLRRTDWERCELPGLVQQALLPFDHHPGLSIEGPACTLPADACTPLVMALHELATNASKYGALSCADGRVEICWFIDAKRARLRLQWRERNGPPVGKPKRRGLGSRLLAKGNALIDVDHLFQSDGVRCSISINGARGAD